MHLLREGHFSVASKFLEECFDTDRDLHMKDGDVSQQKIWDNDLETLRSESLRQSFSDMYSILGQMRARNLGPATQWAHEHRAELEARSSNLEFELARLNYVSLFDPSSDRLKVEDVRMRQREALLYARNVFGDFQGRHLREVQQLVGAMAFCANLRESPYRRFFNNNSAWEELSLSFAREFCSLLGLSAESPLYIAATAGTIALPRLLKYKTIQDTKHTEWTSQGELPVSQGRRIVFYGELTRSKGRAAIASFLPIPLYLCLSGIEGADNRRKPTNDDALRPCDC